MWSMRPAGTLSDEELEDVHETIQIFSKMWRVAGLSITIKAHSIIEAHLIDYLRKRFRGLGGYDEEFGERAYQDGLRHDKRTSNVKSFVEKLNMYAGHDRMHGQTSWYWRKSKYMKKVVQSGHQGMQDLSTHGWMRLQRSQNVMTKGMTWSRNIRIIYRRRRVSSLVLVSCLLCCFLFRKNNVGKVVNSN